MKLYNNNKPGSKTFAIRFFSQSQILSGKVQARSINGSKLLSLLTLLCLSNSAHIEILKP